MIHSNRRVRVAVDAMGGDRGPRVVVAGAAAAVRQQPDTLEVLLVGDEPQIWEALREVSPEPLPLYIAHARDAVAMGEKAERAFRRKRDSSIAVSADLVKQGRADALVSMGNTGAVVTTSLLSMGRMRGIKRPAIASVVPTVTGNCVVLDVGANADCRPLHLYQFAQMGRIYAQLVLAKEHPRVGLLNIGEEPSKGNALTQAAYQLMDQDREALGFIGNVEGRDVFEGNADVLVCDGFTGNVILKLIESILSVGGQVIRREVRAHLPAMAGALLMRPAIRGIKSRINYEEYGGALLLGTRGVCVIGHGRSSPRAIQRAVEVAARTIRGNLEDAIVRVIEGSPATVTEGAPATEDAPQWTDTPRARP